MKRFTILFKILSTHCANESTFRFFSLYITDRNVGGTGSSSGAGGNNVGALSSESGSRLPSEDHEEPPEADEEGKDFPATADHFLVCVFNVSSKVSYR